MVPGVGSTNQLFVPRFLHTHDDAIAVMELLHKEILACELRHKWLLILLKRENVGSGNGNTDLKL